MKKCLFTLAILLSLGISLTAEAGGVGGLTARRPQRMANAFTQQTPWNGNYSYTPDGGPIALVVPPTASSMTAWSWGVAQSEMRPLYHQFGRSYQPGSMGGEGNPFTPTPRWPSHTDNFGVYPVRAPWR